MTSLIKKLNLETYDGMLIFARRLGKTSQDVTTPRPIIVRFLHEHLREEVLQRAPSLGECGLKNVFINPDLTDWQRKEHKELREKAEALNEDNKEELDKSNKKYAVVGRKGEARIILRPI